MKKEPLLVFSTAAYSSLQKEVCSLGFFELGLLESKQFPFRRAHLLIPPMKEIP